LERTFLAPQSLLDSIQEEKRELEQWRGKEQNFLSAGPSGIAMDSRPAEEVERRILELERLLLWIRGHASVLPRPGSALTPAGAQRRKVLGDVSADARELSTAGLGALWADDLGLRLPDDDGRHPAGFSTLVLLEHLHRKGHLSDDQFAEAIVHLIMMNHYFVPLNETSVLSVLKAHAYQLTPVVERVLDRLEGVDVSIDGAVGVTARLLKRLALEPGAALTLRAIAAACITRLIKERRMDPTFELLDAALHEHLMLLPLQLEAIRDVIRRVHASKRAGGSLT
jgi:hypothetical protein